MTKIEWTQKTWNVTTGCSPTSEGCVNCYARRMTKRLQSMGLKKYKKGFQISEHHDELKKPFLWRRPSLVFVNSMSDLFHPLVSADFIYNTFRVMLANDTHEFQILTKRSIRMSNFIDDWPKNIWAGVTVENDRRKYRIKDLKKTNAKVKFISFEPLLSEIKRLNLTGISWVIVGGETGPSARPMDLDWARKIRDECARKKIPFFFKQIGGPGKKCRLLDGQEWNEMP